MGNRLQLLPPFFLIPNRFSNSTALHHLIVENGAHQIAFIIPYLGYARQDRPTQPGEGSMGIMLIEWIQKMNPSKIILLDVHSDLIRKTFGPSVTEISALPLFADAFAKHPPDVIVSPDAGFISRAKAQKLLNPQPSVAVIEKVRPNPNVAIAKRLYGDVRGKDVIIVDDMIDTGGTLSEAVKLVSQNGASSIHLAATHGIFSGQARDRFHAFRWRRMWVTNTLPQIRSPKIRFLDITPLVLNALTRT